MWKKFLIICSVLIIILFSTKIVYSIRSTSTPVRTSVGSYSSMIKSMYRGSSFCVSPLLADYQVAQSIENGRVMYKGSDSWRSIEKKIKKTVEKLDYGIITSDKELQKYTNGELPDFKVSSGSLCAYLKLPLDFDSTTTEDDNYIYIKNGVTVKGDIYYIDLLDNKYQLIIYTDDLKNNVTAEKLNGVLRLPREEFYTNINLTKSWKSMGIDLKKLGISSINQIIRWQTRGYYYQNEEIDVDVAVNRPYKYVLKDKEDGVIIAGGAR